MFDEIINCSELSGLLRQTCEENGVCVTVCDELIDNGLLRHDLIRILKIDTYYSSRIMHNPQASIDCLIIIKTGDREFGLTLVELKGVSNARGLTPKRIKPKFDTTVCEFLSGRFTDIFERSDFAISYFRLWLVANPYGYPPERYRRKIKDTVLGMYLTGKKSLQYEFRGHKAIIEPMPPGQQVCLPSQQKPNP
ncbi:MAG: hypothetical protein BECKG1743D_GA0114223_101573 [Candidatus Kentron sp. G]|nr:MAG: hypothetical protein BECKG1743F_GA0114225_100454 [Candidatus Kentron sp. G]VFM97559.1 MAG: hypothetical protein BECKG1743E_GA0114224_101383 [Candidatus Kentron sp. G]VFM99920.1 MAG: hypothetical protein BECKG1743D_GA0114223_101573 [Candidatus Kentron sp. G]